MIEKIKLNNTQALMSFPAACWPKNVVERFFIFVCKRNVLEKYN